MSRRRQMQISVRVISISVCVCVCVCVCLYSYVFGCGRVTRLGLVKGELYPKNEPEVNSAMFGAEPYRSKPTYPPGEEPALRGEVEERSASPEPVRIRNTDWCV